MCCFHNGYNMNELIGRSFARLNVYQHILYSSRWRGTTSRRRERNRNCRVWWTYLPIHIQWKSHHHPREWTEEYGHDLLHKKKQFKQVWAFVVFAAKCTNVLWLSVLCDRVWIQWERISTEFVLVFVLVRLHFTSRAYFEFDAFGCVYFHAICWHWCNIFNK